MALLILNIQDSIAYMIESFVIHYYSISEDITMEHEDFFDWLACAVVMDDSNWEQFPGFYREVICRKLVRLGVLELKDDEYVLPEPKRT